MEGRAVLIVDDDQPVRELLETAVEELTGIHAISVEDGDAALERARQDRPLAILLDLRLPKRDGISVLRALKSDPATATIPVIVLTTATLPRDRERARDAGCDDYLDKPFDLNDLLAKLRTHIPDRGQT